MDVHRFADRAARAVYATIIGLAVILALEETGAGAGEVMAATVGGVIAAALAELYAAVHRRRDPRAAQPLASGELLAPRRRLRAGNGGWPRCRWSRSCSPRPGRSSCDTALRRRAPGSGSACSARYTALANRLAGLTGVRNAVVTARRARDRHGADRAQGDRPLSAPP